LSLLIDRAVVVVDVLLFLAAADEVVATDGRVEDDEGLFRAVFDPNESVHKI
jgi:hypothetical protein